MNDERRVSAYIDEMLKKPNGAFYVIGWNEDLKQLKHYRWVRNQISHEPGCTEQNMCEPSDTMWLDNFYARIMNQTDPLALYYQATKPRTIQHPPKKQNQPQIYDTSTTIHTAKLTNIIEKLPTNPWVASHLLFVPFLLQRQ